MRKVDACVAHNPISLILRFLAMNQASFVPRRSVLTEPHDEHFPGSILLQCASVFGEEHYLVEPYRPTEHTPKSGILLGGSVTLR